MKLSKTNWIVFFIISAMFILIEFKGLNHLAPGDENVYYSMAKSLAGGFLPYKDFFYAHPPLHIFILSTIIKIFGVNFFILKFATLLALLTSSFFLYKTALHFFKNRIGDKNADLISALALILYLTSFDIMFKATFSMGINFSLMFLTVGFYFTLKKKYFIGGIMAGLAGLTRYYALVPFFAVFIYIFIKKLQEKKIKDFYMLISGFFVTFGIIMLLLFVFFGQTFFVDTVKYHLLKPQVPNKKLIVYTSILKENWMLLSGFILSIFIKEKNKFLILYTPIAAYLLFFLSLNLPEEFYFSIAVPFMSIIAAYSFYELIRRIRLRYLRYGAAAFIVALYFWNTAADIIFLENYGFYRFEVLDKLVERVSKSDSNKAIFGDDSVVPLVALLADRKIALNSIDTNENRFTTGLEDFFLFVNNLDDVDLSYIILRKNMGLHQIAEFQQYVGERCKFERQYSDFAEGIFLLYRC